MSINRDCAPYIFFLHFILNNLSRLGNSLRDTGRLSSCLVAAPDPLGGRKTEEKKSDVPGKLWGLIFKNERRLFVI